MALGRKTGGRKKGTLNKRTQQSRVALKRAEAILREKIPGLFEGDAHAFLMAVYKNPNLDTRTRLEAARVAVSYEKPALSRVEQKTDLTMHDKRTVEEQKAELVDRLQAMLADSPTQVN